MDKPKLEEYLTSDLINKDYKPVVEKRTYEVFTKDQLKERIKKLQDKSIHYGHGLNFDIINEEEVDWAISEAKGILLEIDKFYGIEAEQGDYE